MDTKEKIKVLQEINSADTFLDAKYKFPDLQLGYSFDDKVAFVRRDLRKDITSELQKNKISMRAMANAVGMNYSNLFQYLKGNRPIPEKYLERILGVLGI